MGRDFQEELGLKLMWELQDQIVTSIQPLVLADIIEGLTAITNRVYL